MISIASSIRFRKEDGLLPSFDNLQFNDESFRGGVMGKYFQKVYDTDTVTIQAKLTEGQLLNMQYSLNCWGAWQAMTGETKVTDGADYDYFEVNIDFSAFSANTVQFRAVITEDESVVETWISEPVEILTEEDAGLLQVEFYNIDNAFEVDYSTEIVHILRIEGRLKEYKAGGEASIFDNQSEITKIKDEVRRVLTLQTEPIPRYLAEMLAVALAHDKLFINEVEFVTDSKPEIENSASNFVIFTAQLIQRNIIGLNTHDVGHDCDSTATSDTMVLQELENATAVPAGAGFQAEVVVKRL